MIVILEISLTGSCQIFLDIFFSHAVITANCFSDQCACLLEACAGCGQNNANNVKQTVVSVFRSVPWFDRWEILCGSSFRDELFLSLTILLFGVKYCVEKCHLVNVNITFCDSQRLWPCMARPCWEGQFQMVSPWRSMGRPSQARLPKMGWSCTGLMEKL